jgi:hypothetical protein
VHKRRIGRISMGPILGALGLKLAVVEVLAKVRGRLPREALRATARSERKSPATRGAGL